MLTQLYIENIAVIERASIDFQGDFNVLTGETGAGKSILIDSLHAVLGERTSRDIIRTGERSALVSATGDYTASMIFAIIACVAAVAVYTTIPMPKRRTLAEVEAEEAAGSGKA